MTTVCPSSVAFPFHSLGSSETCGLCKHYREATLLEKLILYEAAEDEQQRKDALPVPTPEMS